MDTIRLMWTGLVAALALLLSGLLYLILVITTTLCLALAHAMVLIDRAYIFVKKYQPKDT